MSSIGSFVISSPYLSPYSRAESARSVAAESAASNSTFEQKTSVTGNQAVSAAPLTPVPESAGTREATADQREAAARQELGGKEAQLELVEQVEIRELSTRDREVRAHEQAHMAVGGQYAGGVSYDYTRGPDGRLYATGGSVSIDISPVASDPAATVDKMQQVQRAALAPAEPSGQDRAVAAQAAQLIAQARAEIAVRNVEDRPAANADTASDEPATTPTVESAEAAPVAVGRRELATYSQVNSSPVTDQAAFSANA